jgi:RNA polymerase-binding transcription factor DksA
MRTRAGRSNPLSICDDTGDPISKERLEAVPEAIYTIEAQKRRVELNLPSL